MISLLSAPAIGTAAAPSAAPRALDRLRAFARRPVYVSLLLLAAVLGIYTPALDGQFLWDDTTLVTRNAFIRSPALMLEAFRHTLFDGLSNFYRPTQTLVFIGDYWAWGLDPFGYHLTNILIHAANACLLFAVLARVLPWVLTARGAGSPGTRERELAGWIAPGVALLWAVHPVHSAAVAYVSGCADTLAMLFCLAAWLACERALDCPRTPARAAWAAVALASFLLGLCSKEIAGIWLALFLGVQIAYRPDRSSRAKWGMAAGAAAVLLLYLVLRHLPPAPPAPPPAPTLPPKALLMIRALGDYGSLMIFPYQLFMERQVFAIPGLKDPPDPAFYAALGIAGGLVAAAFAAGVLCPGRGRALRRFGAAWFLVGYLPISNLFPLNASVAEHWLYLPSIGFLLFLAGVLIDLALLRGRRAAPAVVALVAICAGALAARTYLRTFDWADELTFFRQTIRDGGDVPRARDALATAYGHAHNDAAAIVVLRDICAQYPKALSARINLAMALARSGQTGQAAPMLEAVVPMLLTRGSAQEVIATVHALDATETGPAWTSQRQQLLAGAMRKFPDSWDLVQLVAADFQNRQQNAQALAVVANFAASHWWSAPAHYAAGCLESQLDRPAQALDAWRDAARLDVHDAQAPAAAALLNLDENNLAAARDLGRQAVARQPDSPKMRVLFAHILDSVGDAPGAAGQLAIARQLTANGSSAP